MRFEARPYPGGGWHVWDNERDQWRLAPFGPLRNQEDCADHAAFVEKTICGRAGFESEPEIDEDEFREWFEETANDDE